MQALHVERASAVLIIEGGGEIRLGDGEIVAASTGRVDGYPAILELLSRRSGSFTLKRRATNAAPPLAPMMSLILESARLDDEWRRIANHVLVIADLSVLQDDACMASLLKWIDGHRTVAELFNLEQGTMVALIDSLKRALACGGLSRRPRGRNQEPAVESEQDLNFDELIDLARGRIRADDLEDAERLFHRALDRRPSDRIARQNLRRVAALMSSRRLGRQEKLPGRKGD